MTRTLDYKIILSVAILITVIGVFSIIWQQPWKAYGEVAVGDATRATTTPGVADLTNLCPAGKSASSTTGVLDFVNIHGATQGTSWEILNSTTSDVTLTDGMPTSTALLVDFPAGTATGTMKYGIEFNRGLMINYKTGTASSTIGYRCGS